MEREPRRRAITAVNRRQTVLTAAFLLGSLLVHLLLLFLPGQLFRPAEPQVPVYVEMRPTERRERELDLPAPRRPAPRRATPAKRLGPQDQAASRETAPPGQDAEDRQRRAPRPVTAPPPVPTPVPVAPPAVDAARPLAAEGDRPAGENPPRPRQLPNLQELTTLPPATRARVEDAWRRKLREGVEKGDTVWLDTEQDLLISFFKRFRDNIYNVWNYPELARQREAQGECLLRITISRQGTVEAVELLESSGFHELDAEAVRAVRKGAPYGPLPSAYPHEQLHIMGYFRYSLSRRVIYGERS